MAEEVKLPQLGESVTEGTITAWLVKEGEEVSEDQPLFEISTDKIDTEVPSPASGVLKEIKAQVDDTIEVGAVVAIIDTDGEAAGGGEAEDSDEGDEGEAAAEGEGEDAEEETAEGAADTDEKEQVAAEDAEVDAEAETGAEAEAGEGDEDTDAEAEPATRREDGDGEGPSGDGQASRLMSPIVRKLVREHDLDPASIEGTGKSGRITREDVERAIAAGPSQREQRPAATRAPERPAARKPTTGDRSRTEKLSRVRVAIAKGMWESLQTTAQLTAGMEVDVTRIMQLREQVKDDFERREGVKLSPLPLICRGVCMTLKNHPSMNAAIDVEGGTATYYDYVNLGIAVDSEQGLIVPNIKNADDLTVPALAREIADLAVRTRSRKLQPDEVHGGTFTVTNTGSRGVLFDTPVLNPPEVGILATPKIEKRPVVQSDDLGDTIAIRWMTYLCLTYDHRMVDGADAARFLSELKETLETHDFSAEVGAG